ncbi:hypothetical protein CNBM0030 [Cryptococcus deneoformans B-3501A]|uniref:hypothetical protein n=1 Tax=Cryptococcus deneoformans (strain B-3501A) TaxID=283643 RepID=UPI000042FB4D|nr:hypothetical protein CNBM0030 [Cryptococcus neoformans var. neoformans B-3501A]EAL17619.1 hypothetical protein CNBM0030 [Cryptococcus neoformans var. neoformans B-3501A]
MSSFSYLRSGGVEVMMPDQRLVEQERKRREVRSEGPPLNIREPMSDEEKAMSGPNYQAIAGQYMGSKTLIAIYYLCLANCSSRIIRLDMFSKRLTSAHPFRHYPSRFHIKGQPLSTFLLSYLDLKHSPMVVSTIRETMNQFCERHNMTSAIINHASIKTLCLLGSADVRRAAFRLMDDLLKHIIDNSSLVASVGMSSKWAG